MRDGATVHRQPGNHSKGTVEEGEATAEGVERAVKLKFKPYATSCRFKTGFIPTIWVEGDGFARGYLPPTSSLIGLSYPYGSVIFYLVEAYPRFWAAAGSSLPTSHLSKSWFSRASYATTGTQCDTTSTYPASKTAPATSTVLPCRIPADIPEGQRVDGEHPPYTFVIPNLSQILL